MLESLKTYEGKSVKTGRGTQASDGFNVGRKLKKKLTGMHTEPTGGKRSLNNLFSENWKDLTQRRGHGVEPGIDGGGRVPKNFVWGEGEGNMVGNC